MLFSIRVLTETGCTVQCDKHRVIVRYNNCIILMVNKDKTTDLWTLPLRSSRKTHHSPAMIPMVALVFADAHAHLPIQIAFFMHTVHTKANSICFAHQLLCSPRISTLLKSIWRGYLKGCPILTAKGVTKYLNPSPATTKGYIRYPC
jgi:hypothetical protein